ncbi:MAG: putative DNA binding domain-containing protein [Tannerellaceae bacterium]|jgi:ATP-dependent DNA helicase RecG|nr:putative DNA binding domain-containing protein [Tannerellaceae bacterium]
MDEKEIKQILKQGETRFVEFSKCSTELTDSVFQSVCAFLNKDGGKLIIGVHDFGKIVGVAQIFLANMLARFDYAMEKEMSPAVDLKPVALTIGNSTLLYVDVPPSAEVHRFKGKAYDRMGSETVDITYNYHLVENLYLRKQNESSENVVSPFLKFSELDEAAFLIMRKAIAEANPSHPWLSLSNEEILHKEGFRRRDLVGGKDGFTLASILLFGKEDAIQNYSPVIHRIEAVYRNVTFKEFSKPASEYLESRYDDRDIIFSNLMEAWPRLKKFICRNMPERFISNGSVDVREKIFDEILSNFLIHKEYTYRYPSRLLIFSDRIITENGVRVQPGSADLHELPEPNDKNPLIAQVFRAMGWTGEPGSGRANILKYAPYYDKHYEIKVRNDECFSFSMTYGGRGLSEPAATAAAPAIVEPVKAEAEAEWPVYVSKISKACPAVDISYVDKAEDILAACIKPMQITDMMRLVQQSNRTRFRQNIIRPLLESGLLAMRIPTKPSSPLQRYFTTEKGKALLMQDEKAEDSKS